MADQYEIGKRLPACSSPDAQFPPKKESDEAALVLVDGTETALQYSKCRKLFLTAEGRMGLGPKGAAVGDRLGVFPGGKVVYVLRISKRFGFELIGDW